MHAAIAIFFWCLLRTTPYGIFFLNLCFVAVILRWGATSAGAPSPITGAAMGSAPPSVYAAALLSNISLDPRNGPLFVGF
jgi:hypothetical protein